MARRRLADRFRGQVRAETRLRFDPEVQALRQTKRDVRDQAAGDIRAARSTARGVQAATAAAQPRAAKSFADALAMVTQGPSPGLTASHLGAAASRDAEGAQRRLAETRAALEAELTQRGVDAAAGAALAVRQARATRGQEVGKLNRQIHQVAQRRGLFAQQRTGELVEAERGRRVTRRGQDLTLKGKREGIKGQNDRAAAEREFEAGENAKDRASREKIAGMKGKGKKRATSQQVIDSQSNLDLARRQAKRAKDAGRSRSEAAELLIQGRDNLKDENGAVVPNTSYKAVKQLWASIALDLTYGNRISAANRRRLVAAGYRLADFGIKPPRRLASPTPAREKGGKGKPKRGRYAPGTPG